MSAIALAVGTTVAGIGGSLISGSAARDASRTQAEAADRATELQRDMFNLQQENQRPWVEAGREALPQLSEMAAHPEQFDLSRVAADLNPAMAFNLQQGQQAIERSAAARGGLMTGGTLRDLSTYSQGVASNEYSNAYNRAYGRFLDSQNTNFNRLASLAGIGQTAVGQQGVLGANAANSISNLMAGKANVQAASIMNSGNSMADAFGSTSNAISTLSALNRMQGGGGVGGGGGYFVPSVPSVEQNFHMPEIGSGLGADHALASSLAGA